MFSSLCPALPDLGSKENVNISLYPPTILWLKLKNTFTLFTFFLLQLNIDIFFADSTGTKVDGSGYSQQDPSEINLHHFADKSIFQEAWCPLHLRGIWCRYPHHVAPCGFPLFVQMWSFFHFQHMSPSTFHPPHALPWHLSHLVSAWCPYQRVKLTNNAAAYVLTLAGRPFYEDKLFCCRMQKVISIGGWEDKGSLRYRGRSSYFCNASLPSPCLSYLCSYCPRPPALPSI